MKIKFLKIYKITLTCFFFLIVACGTPVVKVDYKLNLAQAIVDKNEVLVNTLLTKINLSANARNLISAYFDLLSNKRVTLMKKLSISNPMVVNESSKFNEIHRAINLWTFADEIYRIEISTAVRILQREELFIAPSEVDFTKCKYFDSNKCANTARKQLYQFIGTQELQELLEKMAEKDPCINLSDELIGHEIANRCLQKRMGEIEVDLIAFPTFTQDDWYQAF